MIPRFTRPVRYLVVGCQPNSMVSAMPYRCVVYQPVIEPWQNDQHRNGLRGRPRLLARRLVRPTSSAPPSVVSTPCNGWCRHDQVFRTHAAQEGVHGPRLGFRTRPAAGVVLPGQVREVVGPVAVEVDVVRVLPGVPTVAVGIHGRDDPQVHAFDGAAAMDERVGHRDPGVLVAVHLPDEHDLLARVGVAQVVGDDRAVLRRCSRSPACRAPACRWPRRPAPIRRPRRRGRRVRGPTPTVRLPRADQSSATPQPLPGPHNMPYGAKA